MKRMALYKHIYNNCWSHYIESIVSHTDNVILMSNSNVAASGKSGFCRNVTSHSDFTSTENQWICHSLIECKLTRRNIQSWRVWLTFFLFCKTLIMLLNCRKTLWDVWQTLWYVWQTLSVSYKWSEWAEWYNDNIKIINMEKNILSNSQNSHKVVFHSISTVKWILVK